MKKWLLLFLIVPCMSHAQEVRHVKGMKDVVVGGGKTDLGFYGEGGFHKLLSSHFKFGGTLLIESAKYKSIKFNSVYLLPELRYTPFNIKETAYINFGLGGVLNYNTVKVESAKKTGVNYGFELFIEPEVYVSNQIILFVNVRRMWVFNDLLGNTILMGGLGAKYSF